jgi:MFS family permease
VHYGNRGGDMRRARYRVTVAFAVHGAVVGVFATRILWIQEGLHLSPTALGAALVAPAVSACFTMPLAGRVTRWLGARRAVWGLIALFAGCLVLPVLAPSLPLLWLALLLFGGAGGIADVVINANGSEVERLYGRSIMSGLHASWSVGGLAGSALGALGVYAGMDPRAQFAVIGLALVAVSAWAGRGLLDPRPGPNEGPSARFALPERAVLAIGMVAFCAQFSERPTMPSERPLALRRPIHASGDHSDRKLTCGPRGSRHARRLRHAEASRRRLAPARHHPH